MNIRDNHLQLYTPIYDKFLLGTFSEYSQQCLEAFVPIEDNTRDYLVDDLSGLGSWSETEEAEAGETEDPVLGYPKTYTPLKYTKTIQVSYEAVDDDEYALLKRDTQAAEMGTGARDRVERLTSTVLSGGFASTVNSPDGQFLWDTDHPKNRNETGTLYDNLLTGAFSHDNLETAETQITNNLFSMAGIPIPPTETITLMHPPALRGAIARVLNERALERPGTAERDINRFVGRGTTYNYNPVEWIYLSAALGGSDTAWFALFKQFGYLKIIWRAKPHYASWRDDNLEIYNFKGRMRLAAGADNWRGGFASTGL
jgi:hypothetical protein